MGLIADGAIHSTMLQVPYLNLMANIRERAGGVNIRVGGNTQEKATLVPSLANGSIIAKDYSAVSGTTNTPPLEYTPDLLYMMANISSLTNVHWFVGLPFLNTTPFNLDILHYGEAILGDYLVAVQAGNEPDLYVLHGHRPDVSLVYCHCSFRFHFVFCSHTRQTTTLVKSATSLTR